MAQHPQRHLLGGVGVEHPVPEPVHGRAAAAEIQPQHLGGQLAQHPHGGGLGGLMQQHPALTQYHAALVAALLNDAIHHIDQLPVLALGFGQRVAGAPLHKGAPHQLLHPQGKSLIHITPPR